MKRVGMSSVKLTHPFGYFFRPDIIMQSAYTGLHCIQHPISIDSVAQYVHETNSAILQLYLPRDFNKIVLRSNINYIQLEGQPPPLPPMKNCGCTSEPQHGARLNWIQQLNVWCYSHMSALTRTYYEVQNWTLQQASGFRMSKSSWMMDPAHSCEMPSYSATDLAEIRGSSKISSWIWSIISRVVTVLGRPWRGASQWKNQPV